MATLTQFWNILQVALGLGFVIFWHELGHFLLAKWNGVKVEKFSIGFGPTLLGFTRGETEYVLAAVPLGGFVKMLGEGVEEGESQSNDPRAYPNKSVGARMAIISAGVLMNLVLGLACFIWAYGRGMEETPATIGSVFAGSPAYEAGIRAGDDIVAIDGRRDISFENVLLKVRLSGTGQVVRFDVKHPGESEITSIAVKPERDDGSPWPTIGVAQSSSLTLAQPPVEAPAGMASGDGQELKLGLSPGDKVVKAGAEGEELRPVRDIFDLDRVLSEYRDRPITVEVEHTPKVEKGVPKPAPVKVNAVVPTHHFVDFGFRLTAEPISSIQSGSPAEKARFHVGDRIVKVDGDDIDPMRLPDLCFDRAGKLMKFEVERKGAAGTLEGLTLEITPDATPPWVQPPIPPGLPLDVPGLGFAYPIRTKIASVVTGSPAEAAGLKAGDVIDTLTLPDLKPPKKTLWTRIFGPKKPEPFKFQEKDGVSWPRMFELLQLMPSRKVELTVNGSKQPIAITPVADLKWFHPLRGMQFENQVRELPPLGVSASVQRGSDDTVDNILGIYSTLRSLVMGRVSPKMLGGPGTIATVAYDKASTGLTKLIHFLGILSINLAVLNFLPVPPLDGGQMVFLAAEKVRGRPLPEKALAAGTYAGLFLVLGLMAWVICQDVVRLAGF